MFYIMLDNTILYHTIPYHTIKTQNGGVILLESSQGSGNSGALPFPSPPADSSSGTVLSSGSSGKGKPWQEAAGRGVLYINYIYICIYVDKYVHVHMCICICRCMYTYVHTYRHAYIHTYLLAYLLAYLHVYVFVHR